MSLNGWWTRVGGQLRFTFHDADGLVARARRAWCELRGRHRAVAMKYEEPGFVVFTCRVCETEISSLMDDTVEDDA